MSVLMKDEQRGWDARNFAVAMTSKEEDVSGGASKPMKIARRSPAGAKGRMSEDSCRRKELTFCEDRKSRGGLTTNEVRFECLQG